MRNRHSLSVSGTSFGVSLSYIVFVSYMVLYDVCIIIGRNVKISCISSNIVLKLYFVCIKVICLYQKQRNNLKQRHMSNLLKQYRDLETKVLHDLRDKVNNSSQESNFTNTKALKVDLNDKCELVIIHDRLTFIDDRGLYQSVFNESLEDLILILYSY